MITTIRSNSLKRGFIVENVGHIYMKLDALLKEKKMSRTRLSRDAEIQYRQIIKYCKSNLSAITFDTLAKLCYVLDCKVEDLLEYQEE